MRRAWEALQSILIAVALALFSGFVFATLYYRD